MDASRAIKLYGTEEPVAPPRTLRAGALEARLEGGNLRYITIGGVEAIRGIAFLARDRNWGTYNARIEGLDVGQIDYPEAHGLALEGRGLFDVPEELEADLTSDIGEHVRVLTSDEPASAAGKRPGAPQSTTKPSLPPAA